MAETLGLLPWALLFVVAVVSLVRHPRLRTYADATEGPLVSVIVPARNEAGNIAPLLSSLARTNYPNREVIVVDDRSTDGTGDIVEALQARTTGEWLRLIHGADVPEGWFGKPWACWQGYQAAKGEVLLFTDADTRHEPDLLGRSVAALRATSADLFTILPEQTLGSFWERSVMPHMLFMLGLRYNASLGNRTRNPLHVVANGQYIMMPRTSYVAIGGHEAVKHEVVEDLRLAQVTVAAGRRLYLVHAEEFMRTRMYRSLGGILEGWTKNVAIGARYSLPHLGRFVPWLVLAFTLVAWVVPPAILLVEAFGEVPDRLMVWALGATIISLAFWAVTNLRMRVPPLYSLIYPVGAVVTAIIIMRSALRGRRVVWKGREYAHT